MMDTIGLFEHETTGSYFTWSNKHTTRLIYSRIDRALCNSGWFTAFPECNIKILQPHISNHFPLRVRLDNQSGMTYQKRRFTFLNVVTERDDYLEHLRSNWQLEMQGRPMFKLWMKLLRLQLIMRT